MVLLGEGFVAKAALVGTGARVQVKVVFQIVAVQEASRAVGTRIGALAGVFAHVDLEFVIPGERRDEEHGCKLREGALLGVLTLSSALRMMAARKME